MIIHLTGNTHFMNFVNITNGKKEIIHFSITAVSFLNLFQDCLNKIADELFTKAFYIF